MEYHTIYKGPEGETTEWEDLQVKHGNWAPREPKWKPEKYTPESDETKNAAWVAGQSAETLKEAEDAFADDRDLERLRKARLAELQAAAGRPKFGQMELIRGSEFVAKVTEASRASDGTWVVCYLFKESHPGCQLLTPCLEELAIKYPRSKFVKIISTDCIPNYPDINLPTLLIYNNGACKKHVVGLGIFGGTHTTPEQVALVLNTHGPICVKEGSQEDETTRQVEQVKALMARLVEAREARDAEDESSDFDEPDNKL